MSVMKESEVGVPAWLSGVSQQQRQRHESLMENMVAQESRRDQLLGDKASLKAFASARAKAWLNSALGVSLDPDTIKLVCRYKLKIAQRTLVQEDKRTFTELVLFGLHDRNQRFEMIFEGPVPSGLTQSRVESWLSNINLRADFWAGRRKVFNDYNVQIALLEVLGTRIAYSVFAATLQGHLSQSSMAMVERFMQGDRSISASAFVMNGYRFGFRDLIVYQQKANLFGACVLYAPGSPEGQDWFEFPNIRELQFHVAGWVRTVEGISYLTAQAHPAERGTLAKYIATLRELPSAWKGATLTEWPVAPEGILGEAVFHQIAWDQAQEDLAHPTAWRNARVESHQQFARLNTEIKALYTLGTRETSILAYERFSYDLIKQKIEEHLKALGQTVQVNPDQIFIELSEGKKVSLSQLIIKETSFEVPEQWGRHVLGYPRFSVAAEHPALPMLDIRYLAAWSRALRPGEKYIAMLRAAYLNKQHKDYALRREAHLKTQQAEMKRALLMSSYAGTLASSDSDQIFALIENYNIDSVLDFPPFGEAPSSVQYSAMFKFYVKRCMVEGVYVFRLVQGRVIKEILYTPNAPDGVHFRPLNQFFNAIKENGLGQYFYDRVKYMDQQIMGTFINNVEFNNINERLPVLENSSRVLSMRATYDERIERIISDVDAQTTSLNEIIGKLVYDAVVAAASVVSLVVPPVGLALTVVQITKNVVEGATAYRYGDRAAAFNSIKDALLGLASLVPGGKEATKAQKTLIQLIGDGNTIVGLVASVTQQSLSHERLLEVIKQILEEQAAGDSKTVLL